LLVLAFSVKRQISIKLQYLVTLPYSQQNKFLPTCQQNNKEGKLLTHTFHLQVSGLQGLGRCLGIISGVARSVSDFFEGFPAAL
jgi:hypothetical protein